MRVSCRPRADVVGSLIASVAVRAAPEQIICVPPPLASVSKHGVNIRRVLDTNDKAKFTIAASISDVQDSA